MGSTGDPCDRQGGGCGWSAEPENTSRFEEWRKPRVLPRPGPRWRSRRRVARASLDVTPGDPRHLAEFEVDLAERIEAATRYRDRGRLGKEQTRRLVRTSVPGVQRRSVARAGADASTRSLAATWNSPADPSVQGVSQERDQRLQDEPDEGRAESSPRWRTAGRKESSRVSPAEEEHEDAHNPGRALTRRIQSSTMTTSLRTKRASRTKTARVSRWNCRFVMSRTFHGEDPTAGAQPLLVMPEDRCTQRSPAAGAPRPRPR